MSIYDNTSQPLTFEEYEALVAQATALESAEGRMKPLLEAFEDFTETFTNEIYLALYFPNKGQWDSNTKEEVSQTRYFLRGITNELSAKNTTFQQLIDGGYSQNRGIRVKNTYQEKYDDDMWNHWGLNIEPSLKTPFEEYGVIHLLFDSPEEFVASGSDTMLCLTMWLEQNNHLMSTMKLLESTFEGVALHHDISLDYHTTQTILWLHMFSAFVMAASARDIEKDMPWDWQAPLYMQNFQQYLGDAEILYGVFRDWTALRADVLEDRMNSPYISRRMTV